MITSRCIQIKLFHELRSSCKWVIPNYTPKNWFEADIWAITKAGYTREYEIKISKKDFLKDREKFLCKSKSGRKVCKRHEISPLYKKEYKYDKILAGDGPSYFYYVTSEGVIPEDMVPAWAGWIECRKRGKSVVFIKRREPKQLHKNKVPLSLDTEVLTTFYWRFWTEAEKRYNVYERRDKLGRKKTKQK